MLYDSLVPTLTTQLISYIVENEIVHVMRLVDIKLERIISNENSSGGC